jgi:hypothetical protein
MVAANAARQTLSTSQLLTLGRIDETSVFRAIERRSGMPRGVLI